jgi:hypothetical protein
LEQKKEESRGVVDLLPGVMVPSNPSRREGEGEGWQGETKHKSVSRGEG